MLAILALTLGPGIEKAAARHAGCGAGDRSRRLERFGDCIADIVEERLVREIRRSFFFDAGRCLAVRFGEPGMAGAGALGEVTVLLGTEERLGVFAAREGGLSPRHSRIAVVFLKEKSEAPAMSSNPEPEN